MCHNFSSLRHRKNKLIQHKFLCEQSSTQIRVAVVHREHYHQEGRDSRLHVEMMSSFGHTTSVVVGSMSALLPPRSPELVPLKCAVCHLAREHDLNSSGVRPSIVPARSRHYEDYGIAWSQLSYTKEKIIMQPKVGSFYFCSLTT